MTDVNGWWATAQATMFAVGLKIAGAIIRYMAGRWLLARGAEQQDLSGQSGLGQTASP